MKKPTSFLPGIFNEYSFMLLIIMGTLLAGGTVLLFQTNLWGFLPFALGFLMMRGLKWPAESKPDRVWLITVFGKMTTTKVTGPTLVLDWIPRFKIIGYVEFVMHQTDVTIQLKKPILCNDGKYVEGEVSITARADDTSGASLRVFANATEDDPIEDVMQECSEIFTRCVQAVAAGHPSSFMEQGDSDMNETIRKMAEGERGAGDENGNNSSYDDLRGYGLKLLKFIPMLRAPTDVIKARENAQMAEIFEQVMVKRAKLYKEGYKDPVTGAVIIEPRSCPPLEVLRKEVVQEILAVKGDVKQILNQGGFNLATTGI